MTAAYSWALQQAIYAALIADPRIAADIGDRILDGPADPARAGGGPAILIGEETVTPWGSAGVLGAEHRVAMSVAAPDGGFGTLKQLAAVMCEVVLGPLPLARGRVVLSQFLSAKAQRHRSTALRQIDLQFRFVVEDEDSHDQE